MRGGDNGAGLESNGTGVELVGAEGVAAGGMQAHEVAEHRGEAEAGSQGSGGGGETRDDGLEEDDSAIVVTGVDQVIHLLCQTRPVHGWRGFKSRRS
jgi:hypothetical protein